MSLPKDCLFYGLRSKMTDEQEEFVNAIYSDRYDIVFCNAKAGTGKTTMAIATAKLLIEEKKYEELLYVFNPVEEDKMGYRPGTQAEKERDYTVPLIQALIEVGDQPDRVMVNSEDTVAMKTRGNRCWVQAMSHTFARGTNQKNKVVVIDEAQNWTADQLKKMLTRCHDTCKVIVIGHDGQIDLEDKSMSGFIPYIEHFRKQEKASICELTINFRGWIAQCADDLKVNNSGKVSKGMTSLR